MGKVGVGGCFLPLLLLFPSPWTFCIGFMTLNAGFGSFGGDGVVGVWGWGWVGGGGGDCDDGDGDCDDGERDFDGWNGLKGERVVCSSAIDVWERSGWDWGWGCEGWED